MYAEDTEEALTPSHLVIGKRVATLPDASQLTDDDDGPAALQRRARHLNQVLEHFWKRWSKEYLVNLREFHQAKAGPEPRKPKIGDVVIIHDDGLPRGSCRTGEIREYLPSRDGEVRGVILKVTRKNGKHATLRRPVQKLFPLDVNAHDAGEGTEMPTQEDGPGSRS